jgi:hypothetical protein
LASYAAWQHRFVAFLGILLAQGVFGLVAFGLRQSWEGVGVETVQAGLFMAGGSLVMSVALSLAGVLCRGRYGRLRLTLWLIAALVAIWLVLITPLLMISVLASGSSAALMALFSAVVPAAGMTIAAMLPFLVLSFANGFYRERLKGLLHLGDMAPPPIIAPPMPAVPEVTGG